MRYGVLLTLLGWLIAATPASAATWARLTQSEIDDITWVDLDSIKAVGRQRKAWVRWKYGRARAKGAVEAVDLSDYDCDSRQIRFLSGTSYGSSGEVVSSITARPYELEWQPVVPDSMGERHMTFICTYPIGADWRQIEGLVVER